MAEVVHRNLEAMLPQLEELETSGIFSHDEIRTIVKFRRNHEYRMIRRPSHKDDFLAAIQYELHLDLLRKRRKKRLGVTGTRRDADYGIQNRVHGLFRRALKKFKGDLKLWLQYIEFAKKSGRKLSLGQIYGRALAIHPNCTSLWIMAAKFQLENIKDASSARSLLQQGLRANNNSQHLWLEYFRMELMHTDKIRKRREILKLKDEQEEEEEEVSDDFLSYKVASIVYHQASKAIPNDVEFRLAFLPICCLFDETQSLQDEIYDSIKKDFPLNSLTWDALARRHWIGIDTSSLKDSQVSELELKTEKVFSEGLSLLELESSKNGVDPNKKRILEHYFKWSLERWNDNNSSRNLKKKAKKRLVTSFEQVANDGQLSVQMYLQYVKLLVSFEMHKEASLVLSVALRAHPTSAELWLMQIEMLRTHSPDGEELRNGEVNVKELGELCRKALGEVQIKDSLPIWLLWLEKITESSSQEDVEDIFMAGVSCGCDEVAEPLASCYLDWALSCGGLSKARKTYSKLLKHFPVPYSLYEKCLELERQALTSSSGGMKRLRSLLEKAVRDYGDVRVDLWLKYISAELYLEEGSLEEVGKLYWRAMKELQPSLTATFVEHYSLLHSSMK